MRTAIPAVLMAAGWLVFLPGFYSGTVPKWIALYLVAAGLVAWIASVRRPIDLDGAGLALLCLLGWAGVSLGWSADWRAGLIGVLNGAALFGVYLAARHASRETLARVLPWAAALGIAGAAGLRLWWPETHGGFGNANFLAAFVLVLLPFLTVKRWGWLLVIAGVAFLALKVDALLGAFLGGTWNPEASIGYRVALWDASLRMWYAHVFGGLGFGSFDYEYPRWAGGEVLQLPHMYAGAVHNDFLQLLAELGLIGAWLVFAVLYELQQPCSRLERAAVWSLGIIGCLALIGFPLQHPATASIGAIALGIATRGQPVFRWRPYVALPALSLAAVCLIAYGAMSFTAQSVFALVNLKRPLDAYVFAATAHKANPLDPLVRHHLYLLAANAGIEGEAMERAEAIGRSAMPWDTRQLMIRAERAPKDEALRLVIELERRRIDSAAYDIAQLRKRIEGAM